MIIPVYNVEEYLYKCINSVLSQTYENLEIILIDDGSSDGSVYLCDEFSKKDHRIKVIHQTNQGVSAARNVGLGHATGEYIAFLDGDDWIEPDMYERMLKVLKKYSVSMVACGWYIEEKIPGVKEPRGILKEKSVKQPELLELVYQPSVLNGVLWNKLFCADMIYDGNHRAKHYFDETIKVWEDVLWLSKIILSAEVFSYLIPDHFYHYIRRSNSTVAVGFHPDKLTMIDSAWKIREELIRHQTDQKTLAVFDNYVHIHFRGAIYEIYYYAPQFKGSIGRLRGNALRIGKYKLLCRNAKIHNLLLLFHPRIDAWFIALLVKLRQVRLLCRKA